DYAAIVSFLLAHPEITGPVNLTTPHPVTNAEFTSALAAAVHRPGLLFLPERALKLALGDVSSDILSSARVMPRRLEAAGYRFRFPDLPAALAAELAAGPRERGAAGEPGRGPAGRAGNQRRKPVIAAENSAGSSSHGKWPPPGWTVSSPRGNRPAARAAASGVGARSTSPA